VPIAMLVVQLRPSRGPSQSNLCGRGFRLIATYNVRSTSKPVELIEF
jgi:hypothetical protein